MKKRKTLVGICLALGVMAFCGGISSFSEPKVSAAGELSVVSYEDTYVLGDTLSIQDAKISYKGTEYTAQGILHFPSGKAFNKESVILTESGNYTLEYRAQAEDVVLSEQVDITVLDKPYTFVGNGEAVYGVNEYVGEEINGINVSMARGTTFRYNSVIDVSDNTASDVLLRLYCTPKQQGVREVERFIVRLTDIYDTANYVDFIYRAGDASGESDSYTYITANANGQLPSGVEKLNKETSYSITYENEYYRLFQNDKYGFNGMATFNGLLPKYLPGGVFKNNAQELKIDYESKKIYAQRASVGSSNFVIDLDAEEFFGKNTWKGFTTGEVILSISAVGNSAEFNYFIRKIDDHDLSVDCVKNAKEPWISINYLGYEEDNLSKAVVNRAYPLFPAVAQDDFDNEIDCKTSVYFNYDNSSRSQLNVTNGAFVPKRAGIYTIVYTATDSFGNKAEKLIEVEAIERENISYSFGEKETLFEVGTPIKVASIEIENPFVGAKITKQARLVDTNTVYAISEKTGTFLPMYAGEYQIEYIYEDYVQTEVLSYAVNVAASSKPKIFGSPIIPKFFIKDCTYVLPEYHGYDFTNGTKELSADIYVKEGTNAERKLDGNTYTADGVNETVELTYRVTNTGGKDELRFEIPVVDTGYGKAGQLNLSKYLYSKQFESQMSETDITYTTNVQSAIDGTSTLELINAAYVNVFEISFGLIETKNAFGSVKIVLTDESNQDNQVEIVYSQNGAGSLVSVAYNGENVQDTSTSAFDGSMPFGVSVQNEKLVFVGSELSLLISDVFANFGSKKFYVTISLEEVRGEAAISFTRLMNQTMKNSRNDGVSPILIYTPFKEEYLLGDTFVIDRFDYYDFVDPCPTFSYTVRDANGNFVTSIENVLMDGKQNDYRYAYTLSGAAYATYSISGTLTDYAENIQRFPYTLTVKDTTPPTLSLDSGTATYDVGDTVKIAGYTVSDTHCETQVFITFIDPTGHIQALTENEFTASKKGVYTIMYRAVDTEGNVTFAEYQIRVK